MMRLKSDLVELCNAALSQNLANTNTEWDKRSALGVVLAAGDYPDSYAKNFISHDWGRGISTHAAGIRA
jgi:phosphoribosylamine--glycine ligase